jgi:hypothetical protein
VWVDGQERQLDDGVLWLEAEPGESFAVTVRDGDQELERTVVVTKDGTAEPDRLELAPAKEPRGAAVRAAAGPRSTGSATAQAPASKAPAAASTKAKSEPFSPIDKW